MNNVLLVATREIAEKIRNRGFIVFSVFLLLLPVVGGAIGALTAGAAGGDYRVGLTGDATSLAPVLERQAGSYAATVKVKTFGDPEAAEQAVRRGEVDAAVVGLDRVLVDGTPGVGLETFLQSSVEQARTTAALREAAVSPEQARNILAPEPLSFRDVGEGRGGEVYGAAAAVTQIGMVFLFLTVFTYGYWIANGVVEEKASRVVEVILSSIRPVHLLAGKILGIGLLGLGQILLVAGLGLLTAYTTGLEVPAVALGVLGAVILWFVLGYAFYSCLFAVAGSLVSKQEDLQYTQMPLMVLIFAGYGAAFYEFTNPGSTTTGILSFIPPFSPMVMLMRMGLGETSAPEVAAAATLTILATAALMVLATRLYAGSVLRFGSRVSLRDAWRSARGKGF